MSDDPMILHVDDGTLRTWPEGRSVYIEAARAKIKSLDEERARIAARIAYVESMGEESKR
ncbi:MAG: hypothetical protein LUO93_01795 [Methanomicrobiales archaeon]|nr:hypothetical protein [Methanomicrobiales archaeon]